VWWVLLAWRWAREQADASGVGCEGVGDAGWVGPRVLIPRSSDGDCGRLEEEDNSVIATPPSLRRSAERVGLRPGSYGTRERVPFRWG
jgi:hypothetical protein